VTIGRIDQPFKVKVKSRDLDAVGISGFPSLDVTMQLGNDIWSGAAPPCVLSSSGSTFNCR
jgi:hypothetical protein